MPKPVDITGTLPQKRDDTKEYALHMRAAKQRARPLNSLQDIALAYSISTFLSSIWQPAPDLPRSSSQQHDARLRALVLHGLWPDAAGHLADVDGTQLE
jgi:ribonuclease I